MKKVALAVMRLQPLHNGHKVLIDAMLSEAEIALVGIGSIDKSDKRNPFSFDDRKAMVESLYAGETRLKTFGLRDIDAKTKREWADFVLREIKRLGLPDPACYYAGERKDGEWFSGVLPIRIVDRLKEGGGVSGAMLREAFLGDTSEAPIPEAIKRFLRNKR
ncbi:MAG: adenylyltransferase/cytidyltransferase family protein [Helicobacteraceae bacterium]|jgi:cytidyltransferase-like protein|nr:adenylyltransferase/cytidyltransferase family protein [Helicobacteraceae bacterium]